ncbi:MAG: hypothetical protein KAU23_00600 [Anaerolineales bacterium]|nr:hypothetical protein [Anaerolineales bacterium]
MFKKIILWTLYAGLTGILIFGAVNRTSAKMGEVVPGENEDLVDYQSQGGQGGGQGGNGGGRSLNGDDYEGSGIGENEDCVWVSLTGAIFSFSTEEMQVVMHSGETINVADRAWRFALEQGFDPRSGDQVVLRGFFEGDAFEMAEISNLTTGQVVVLRDEFGHPLWAGNSTH